MKKIAVISILLSTVWGHNLRAEEFTLTVDNADVQEIGLALGERPFSKVSVLIEKLRSQIASQVAAKNKPADKPKTPELPKTE